MVDLVHMSHSMMDSVDVRIEGMEEMMTSLTRKIRKLQRKVGLARKLWSMHDNLCARVVHVPVVLMICEMDKLIFRTSAP